MKNQTQYSLNECVEHGLWFRLDRQNPLNGLSPPRERIETITKQLTVLQAYVREQCIR